MLQRKGAEKQIRVQGRHLILLKIAEYLYHLHTLAEHVGYLLHAHVGKGLVVGQNHHSPVFSHGIHALTGRSQVKGDVAAFHI